MSVCQYYLRGNCRYGDRCRLSHVNDPYGPPYRPRGPRPQFDPNYIYRAPRSGHANHYRENTATPQQQHRRDSPVTKWIHDNFSDRNKTIDILIEIKAEAQIWQKSADFWRFTSRRLFPCGHLLEDWIDQSFEELKWTHRCMAHENKEHVYKKAYFDYWEKTERQLIGLTRLDLEILKPLKPYIEEYIQSQYQPSKTLSTDIQMRDVNDNRTSTSSFHAPETNYTPSDQILEEERAAFESDAFEFGQIPTHAPPQQFC
ncbi:unnamed protein product [Rotaria magnacalcarata]|uniref:Nucleoporin NUP42 n=1 Tax=Rotaria magnacalcarata TaxID=392030 RepID=A0A817A656_9BILA|nr:unnamed protein product [Rotaria magnacalcarata]CAF3922336.1 unnamed protein product [Rotaria magnacalcarata]